MPDDDKHAWVERVLGIQTQSAEPWDIGDDPEPRRDGPLVAYRKALLGFGAARQEVRRQLQTLSAAISDQLPEEAVLATRVADDIDRVCETLSLSLIHI